MNAFDPSLASPFHVDWIAPLDERTEDDYARAVAEKAEALLRGAQFVSRHRDAWHTDTEVRVWVEAACGSACVAVTWEPGARRFGFYLLDETLRERLACIVFHDLPCVDADAHFAQGAALDAAARTLRGGTRDDRTTLPPMGAVRVQVEEGPQDAGVEP